MSAIVALRCVDCGGRVASAAGSWHCDACGRAYAEHDAVPFFLPKTGLALDEQDVESLYNTVAHDYDLVFKRHIAEHYLSKRTAVVASLVPRQARVLDVGCGSGRLASWIMSRGYEVHGCDLSAGMLRVALERGLAGVYGALGTALPFEDGTFDLTLTVATLHHLKTPERVTGTIREMGRVLRPGGLALIWDHNPRNPYWPSMMKRCPQDRGDERLVPMDEVLDAVAEAGLGVFRAFRSGFIPEFVPAALMPMARALERVVECTPGIRSYAAHNVMIAQKPATAPAHAMTRELRAA